MDSQHGAANICYGILKYLVKTMIGYTYVLLNIFYYDLNQYILERQVEKIENPTVHKY